MRGWLTTLCVCLGAGGALASDRASARRDIERAIADKNCSHARRIALRLLKSAADEAEAASLYLDLALVAECDGEPCEEADAYDRWLGWGAGRDDVDRSLKQFIGRQRDAAADRCPARKPPGPGDEGGAVFEIGLAGALGALDSDAGWQRTQARADVGLRVGEGSWRAELDLGWMLESMDVGQVRLGGAFSPRGAPLFMRVGGAWALGAVSGPGLSAGLGGDIELSDRWRVSLAVDATWWFVPALWPVTGQIGVWYAL